MNMRIIDFMLHTNIHYVKEFGKGIVYIEFEILALVGLKLVILSEPTHISKLIPPEF